MNILNTDENHNLESSWSPIAIIITTIFAIIMIIIVIVKLLSKNTISKNTILINSSQIQINLPNKTTHKFSHEIYSEIINPDKLYEYLNTSISKDEFTHKYNQQMEIIKHCHLNGYKITYDPIVDLIAIIQKNMVQENMQTKYKPSIKLTINNSSNNDVDKYTLILANMLIFLENVCYNENIQFIEPHN